MEGGEAFWGFGLQGDGFYGGEAGAGVRPVDQAADIVGRAFEDRFDPAVGQVAHPAGHAVLLGQAAAAVTEEDALYAAGDQHPIADHKQRVRLATRPGTNSGRGGKAGPFGRKLRGQPERAWMAVSAIV